MDGLCWIMHDFFLKVFLYLQNMWFSIVEFVRNFKYIRV